jgi:hypothetical protein
MPKPHGLSFYKRIGLGRFLSVNPSTNGLSISVGIPGARLVLPLISFVERPPMVNIQKYGVRYRRYLVDIESILEDARIAAGENGRLASQLYRKAEKYARTERSMSEIQLGRGYTGQRRSSLEQQASQGEYYMLGVTIRGDYERFLEIIEEIRKK